MKKKITIVAMATAMATALVASTLVVPIMAANNDGKEDIGIEFPLPDESFKCDDCGKEFNTEEELKIHKNNSKEEIEWDIGDLNCPNCGEFVLGYHECKKNYFDIEDGDSTTENKETFKCDKCGDKFSTKEELEEHKTNSKDCGIGITFPVTDNTTFKCDKCDKEFDTEEELNKHKNNAKEEIELVIPLENDDSGDPNSKEDIEIEIPLNDNTEQIAILETEVIEAEKIASEARAEADRLTTIATEKRAELEALRQ